MWSKFSDTETLSTRATFQTWCLSVFMAIDWNVINWIEGRKTTLTVIKLKLLYKDPEFAAFYSSWKYQNKIRPDNTTKKRFSASKYGVPTKRTDWVHSAILLKNTTYQYNCTLVTSRCRDNLRGDVVVFWRYLSNLAMIMSWVCPALVRAEKLMLIGRNLKGRRKKDDFSSIPNNGKIEFLLIPINFQKDASISATLISLS